MEPPQEQNHLAPPHACLLGFSLRRWRLGDGFQISAPACSPQSESSTWNKLEQVLTLQLLFAPALWFQAQSLCHPPPRLPFLRKTSSLVLTCQGESLDAKTTSSYPSLQRDWVRCGSRSGQGEITARDPLSCTTHTPNPPFTSRNCHGDPRSQFMSWATLPCLTLHGNTKQGFFS